MIQGISPYLSLKLRLNRGFCHCCRSRVIFRSTDDWLRDHYLCTKCHSKPRQRNVLHILDTHYAGWEGLSVHESSPSNDFVSRHCQSYSSSQLLDGIELGSESDGVRCEDLERLTFDDGTFDIFVTQDVFEHVLNPDMAARQINRVLKVGGFHIFTAPKHKGTRKSYPRAKRVNGEVVHLLEEIYHGNPVGDGRSLVTWDYGDDFEELLFKWTRCPTITYVTRDRRLGLDGEYLEVFVTRKV